MPATNLKALSTYLKPSDHAKLKKLAEKEGRTAAGMARIIIERALEDE